MSISINYNQMPIADKFLMLEKLWENMTLNASENGFTPKWHLDVLKQREENTQNSKSSFNDLEDMKNRLQKLV